MIRPPNVPILPLPEENNKDTGESSPLKSTQSDTSIRYSTSGNIYVYNNGKSGSVIERPTDSNGSPRMCSKCKKTKTDVILCSFKGTGVTYYICEDCASQNVTDAELSQRGKESVRRNSDASKGFSNSPSRHSPRVISIPLSPRESSPSARLSQSEKRVNSPRSDTARKYKPGNGSLIKTGSSRLDEEHQ
jgi:hypothetical protein